MKRGGNEGVFVDCEGGGKGCVGSRGEERFVIRGDRAFKKGQGPFMVDAKAKRHRTRSLSGCWGWRDDVQVRGVQVAR